MRASATISLLVLALFGVAFAQQTVFVSDTDVRATLSASGNTQSRTWVGTAALNSATYIGWEGQYNSQTQSASGSIALVNSFSPNTGLGVAPYSVNWAYVSAQGNQNGGSATFSASAVASSFRIYGYIVYTDGNNNGVYDQGEETSLHTFDTGLGLGSASATVQAAANGKPANILVTHTTSDSKLRYIIANGDVTSQGVFNKAENAKIDFWFQPAYSANDASNARVALVTAYAGLQASVQGGGSVSTGSSGNSGQGSLSWSANGFKTQLSWTPTAAALVGGAKTSVTLKSQVLSLDQDTGFSIKAGTYVNGNQVDTQFTLGKDSGSGRYAKSNLLLFSFDAQKPTELYWDPSVGQSNNAFAKTASVLVVLASIAVALF